MATLANGVEMGWWSNTSNTRWCYIFGDVTRSGNTVTLSNLSCYWTFRYDSWANNLSTTMYVNGTATGIVCTFNGRQSNTYYLNNTSFSVSTTQTSATLSCSEGGDTGYFTVSFPSGASAPTGLSVSDVSSGVSSFSAVVSITGWGVGSGTRSRELQVWTQGMVQPRRYQPQEGDSLSGTITCDNSSLGDLTIVPNTMYTIGAYATNGQANTGSQNFNNYTTLPDSLQSKSAETVDTRSIKINYTTKADGGKYAKEIQYSLDNSTWTTGATVSGGSSTSGSFIVTGLSVGQEHTVYLRVTTSVGSTDSGSVSARTKSACKIIRSGAVIEAIPKIVKPNGDIIETDISVV